MYYHSLTTSLNTVRVLFSTFHTIKKTGSRTEPILTFGSNVATQNLHSLVQYNYSRIRNVLHKMFFCWFLRSWHTVLFDVFCSSLLPRLVCGGTTIVFFRSIPGIDNEKDSWTKILWNFSSDPLQVAGPLQCCVKPNALLTADEIILSSTTILLSALLACSHRCLYVTNTKSSTVLTTLPSIYFDI